MVSHINRCDSGALVFFYLQLKKYLIKKTHGSGKRIPTRRSANAVIFYFFRSTLNRNVIIRKGGERRRGRTITNDARTFYAFIRYS